MKIMVLNAQDLFLFMDKYQGENIHEMTEQKWQLMSASLFMNKPKEKCFLLGKTILNSQADIVMMTEVGGLESLKNFAKYVLNDEFFPLTLPSNSDRGIDLGYLIRKDLNYSAELHSYVNFPLPLPAKRFSRDVLRLDLKIDGEFKMILLLVHIKSKLDMRRKDFQGRTQRAQEVKGLLDIYKELLHHNVPILIGGDFNGHAGEKDTEEEFQAIYKDTDLKDVAHLTKISDEDRFSYIYFTQGGNRFVQQIDYLFISERFSHLLDPLECYFPRYVNLEGGPFPVPTKIEQKNILPSDHYPFLATLKI